MSTQSLDDQMPPSDRRRRFALALMDFQDRCFENGAGDDVPRKLDEALERRGLSRHSIPGHVDLGERDCEYGRTLLARAAFRGTLAEVMLWLPGSDPDAEDLDGMTPIMHAAIRADGAQIISALLAEGASPDRLSHENRDALGLAIQFGNDECARELLSRIDAKRRDATGMTRLMSAAVSRAEPARALRCAQLLIPLSDLGALDSEGMSALGHAVRCGNHGVTGAIRSACERSELAIATAPGVATGARQLRRPSL